MNCPCCGFAGTARRFLAREMMFGWREPFAYLECSGCLSLQIERVPADLPRFYPSGYYSQQVPATVVHTPSAARALVARLLLRGGPRLTRCLRERYPFLHWTALGGIGPQSAVLDVGCGAGVLLRRLRRWGYADLTGIDPYLVAELHEPGLRLRRCELAETGGRFALVMMHHVLEHLPDPGAALRLAAARLAPGGRLLVRLPLAATPLAREYGPDWFNLDAPRHLVIPSRAGLLRLFAAAGLRVVHEEYDSTPLTPYYSECYRRDVAMREAAAPEAVTPDPAVRRRIRQLNAAGLGDSGVFVAVTGGDRSVTAPLPAAATGV